MADFASVNADAGAAHCRFAHIERAAAAASAATDHDQSGFRAADRLNLRPIIPSRPSGIERFRFGAGKDAKRLLAGGRRFSVRILHRPYLNDGNGSLLGAVDDCHVTIRAQTPACGL